MVQILTIGKQCSYCYTVLSMLPQWSKYFSLKLQHTKTLSLAQSILQVFEEDCYIPLNVCSNGTRALLPQYSGLLSNLKIFIAERNALQCVSSPWRACKQKLKTFPVGCLPGPWASPFGMFCLFCLQVLTMYFTVQFGWSEANDL